MPRHLAASPAQRNQLLSCSSLFASNKPSVRLWQQSGVDTIRWKLVKLWLDLHRISLLLILVSTGLVVSASAQYRPPAPYFGARRGAVLTYISGEVSVAPADTNQWSAARLNQALSPSEYIWTGKNSRAEINVGGAYLRLNSEVSVTLRTLTPNTVQLGVNQGEVSFTVVRLFPGQIYELDTPNATLTVMKPGTYSVDALPAEDQTLVTTRRGSIVATGTGNAVTINSGHQVRFRSGTSLQHTAEKAPPEDGFEQWASVRNQRLGIPRPNPFVVFGYGPWPYGPPLPPPY